MLAGIYLVKLAQWPVTPQCSQRSLGHAKREKWPFGCHGRKDPIGVILCIIIKGRATKINPSLCNKKQKWSSPRAGVNVENSASGDQPEDAVRIPRSLLPGTLCNSTFQSLVWFSCCQGHEWSSRAPEREGWCPASAPVLIRTISLTVLKN